MLERLSWKKIVLELLVFCLPALILSLFFGFTGWFLAGALFAVTLWHGYNLLKLSDWLWLDRSVLPPPGRSSWEPIFYGIYQLQQRNRKRRRELATLIKRFRSGAESLPDAVVMMTEDGNIFWCNRHAQNLLGFRWPDDNGQHIFNLLRYPDFSRYLTHGDFSLPLTLELNNGTMMELRIMPYAEGQILMVARDVTEKRRLENSRRDFFANVSHELRTPLTVLQGYLEMLADQDFDNPMNKKAIITMQAQTRRMDGMVKQLLQLSKIEVAVKTEFDQSADIPGMLMMLQQEAQTLSHGLHDIRFDIDEKLKIFGDEDELRSAMSNLVYNAVNHTPEHTRIDVRWAVHNGNAVFSVKDTGPGIPAEHLSRLTERFYRVDKSRSRQTGGSGLGLAIVKHALQHHHTHLDIVSKPGKGAEFSFTIPAKLIVKSSH